MLSNKINIFTALICLLGSFSSSAQLVSVEYQMKFDPATCWFDCYIVVNSGQAYSVQQRTQGNSQLSVLIPTGSTMTVAQTYNPIRNNHNNNGTVPQSWNKGASALHPAIMPDIDFWSITPTLYPLAQYDSLNVGDTVKLFSLNINMPNSLDHDKIRIFENGTDPGAGDLGGGDFSNGFTAGGPTQLYTGNAFQVYPPEPYNNQTVIDTSTSALIIDIDPVTSSICQGLVQCSWSGPGGFSSVEEDVNINPFTPANLGDYTLVMMDEFGLQDTAVIKVEAAPNNEVELTGLLISPAINSIGIQLNISGDENKNAQLISEFRRSGEAIFHNGSPSMRVYTDTEIDGSIFGQHFVAASFLDLSPHTSYDLRLTLHDPDNNSPVVIDTIIHTQGWHLPIAHIDTLYVMPGNGGGDGSNGNPYQGIQAAVDNANPGDIIMVNDGTYDPFSITNGGNANAPIQLTSMNLHGAILDGNNTSTGIITIGSFSDSIAHVIIDGFDIRNGKWGIDAQHTQYLIVRNNKIEDVDYGFVNRRENGWEHHQYVFNNKVTGRTTWPQTNGNIPNERGVDIRGNYNDVSYNTISDFGDGISTDGPMYMTSYALDIHHNDITRIVDDMIEIDGIVSNARVYNNRCFNGRAGISLAPIFGGPAYVYRNELVNMEYSALKMNRSPSGLIIAHNSIINSGDGMSSPSGWKNVYFYNNLIFAGNYCFQEYQLAATDTLSWDYNGYYSDRTGNTAQPWFKWDNLKYNILTDLNSQTNLEEHGVQVTLSDAENVTIPAIFSTEVAPATINMTPQVNSPIHNSGKVIENLNDGYVTDNMPDIGAIELGGPIPVYGHDFGITCDRNDLSLMTWNGSKNDNWYEQYNWTPCGIPFELSEVIVPGLISQYPIINTDVHVDKMSLLQNAMTTVKGEGVDVIIGQ